MSAIMTFERNTEEYKKLKMVAEILTYMSGQRYRVDDVFYDYGQNWMWTTILSEVKDLKNFDWCQALCPAEQETILRAVSIDDLVATAKWILDKKNK